MYSGVLLLHSWLRWVVLFAALYAIVRAIGGASSRRSWAPADEAAGRWLIIAIDLQFVLGALLYFVLSPFTEVAFRDFGAAMRNSGLRFWAVEHLFGMVIGTALAHVGRVRIRKAPDTPRRHRIAMTFFILALLAFLVSIPWPGMPNGRPLFRF